MEGEGIVGVVERDEPYVGVHVRRGDKVSEVTLAPIEAFAAAAHAIASWRRRSQKENGGDCVIVVSDKTLASETVMRCVCLLLQDLLQSCSRGGRRIVEDMCYERRRAEAFVD